jgi:hypothetical protein
MCGQGLECLSACRTPPELSLAAGGNGPSWFCFKIVLFYSKNVFLMIQEFLHKLCNRTITAHSEVTIHIMKIDLFVWHSATENYNTCL